MSSILDTLITDRGPDAHYNYTDLNRVGEAVVYVADLLRGYGYDVTVSPRTNWTRTDFPAMSVVESLLADVRKLRDVYSTLPTTPPLPATMNDLTHTGANSIEQLLLDLDQLIQRMAEAWFYTGEIYCGEA